MKKVTVPAFSKFLAVPAEENLFVFYGEERFFIDRLITDLEVHLFKGKSAAADRPYNSQTFYGTENTLAEIISACMSFSMFSEKKLVIVKEFDRLKLGDGEPFSQYIRHPQKSTVLVLTAEKWGTSKVYQEILQQAVSVQCKPLPENELYTWLSAKVKDANIKIDRESLLFLIENIGNNLLRLNTEIEKIVNYTGPGGTVNLDLVTQLTGFSRELNIFNFQKSLALRNLTQSLKIGLRLLEQGEALAGILPMLSGFFRKIWLVRSLRSKNLKTGDILQQLGGTTYSYQDVLVAAERFTALQIQASLEEILQAEIQLKTSQKSHDSILTMLCYNICCE
jgi:DNA polymerase III subunit delta